MSKELAFTDDNDVVKYLDTTTAFNLALTADGVAFDLTNAKSILVKIANDDGYIMQEAIDLTTVTSPLGGTLSFPINQDIMNTLVPDDYDIEVWVTMNDGTQAIFPSDGTLGFSIEDNLMSDTGEVIPTITLNDFKQQFNDLSNQMENAVHNVQKGDKGDKGDTGDTGATGPIGPQGPQGERGKQIFKSSYEDVPNSSTNYWSDLSPAVSVDNPPKIGDTVITPSGNIFQIDVVTVGGGGGGGGVFGVGNVLGNIQGDKGDKGDTGATGATGPTGPQGPVGSGLVVKGTVNDASQLPTTGNQEGYCYFIGTDLYVWDAGAWKNCGNVSPDLSNYVTVTDLNNGLSAKVNVSDMRKSASDVAGIEEVNAKQDKIGYTPADDSKVVHNSGLATIPTDNSGLVVGNNGDIGFVKQIGSNGVIGVGSNNVFRVAQSNNSFMGMADAFHDMFKINGNYQISLGPGAYYFTPADDSKVAHLSGTNNFDTVPTVNNNPLLLASSLPSDLARTGQDANFTGKLQKSGIDVATTTDVTNAVNTATANAVTTDKLANFTAGLQSKGVDVATVGVSVGDIYPMKPDSNPGSGLITITKVTDKNISGTFELSALMVCSIVMGTGVPSFPDKFIKNISITIEDNNVQSFGQDVSGTYSIIDYGKGILGFNTNPGGSTSTVEVLVGSANGTFTCDV